MPNPKSKWKRAPKDQRRLASERTAPKARFTRSQRSGSLPESLPSAGRGRSAKPLLLIGGVLVLLVGLSVLLVIAVGSAIHAQQQLAELNSQAAYYGRPTQPFATLVPDFGRRVGTTVPLSTTPLPGFDPGDQAASGFPDFPAPDDPRWQAVTISPMGGSFEVRGAPTTLNNDPIQTFVEATPGYIVTDSDWGVWAQIMVGTTTAWLDTSTVTIKVAP